jgi:hypothetical protein
VKYWEIIADNLGRAGWSWGMTVIFQGERKLYSVDAFRKDRRYVVQAEDILTAFLALDSQSMKDAAAARADHAVARMIDGLNKARQSGSFPKVP